MQLAAFLAPSNVRKRKKRINQTSIWSKNNNQLLQVEAADQNQNIKHEAPETKMAAIRFLSVATPVSAEHII